jgi:hypothetical protein
MRTAKWSPFTATTPQGRHLEGQICNTNNAGALAGALILPRRIALSLYLCVSGVSGTFHTLSLHHPHGVYLSDPLGWRQHGFSTDGTGEQTEADDLHRIPAPSLKILA